MSRAIGEKIMGTPQEGVLRGKGNNTCFFLWSGIQSISHECSILWRRSFLTTLTAKTYTTQHDGEFWELILFLILLFLDCSTFFEDGSGILCKMQATTAGGHDIKRNQPKIIFARAIDGGKKEEEKNCQSFHPNQRGQHTCSRLFRPPSHVSDSSLNTTAQTAKRTSAYRRNSC